MNLVRIENGIFAGVALATLIVSASFVAPTYSSDVVRSMFRPTVTAVSIAAGQVEHFASMLPAVARVKRTLAE